MTEFYGENLGAEAFCWQKSFFSATIFTKLKPFRCSFLVIIVFYCSILVIYWLLVVYRFPKRMFFLLSVFSNWSGKVKEPENKRYRIVAENNCRLYWWKTFSKAVKIHVYRLHMVYTVYSRESLYFLGKLVFLLVTFYCFFIQNRTGRLLFLIYFYDTLLRVLNKIGN